MALGCLAWRRIVDKTLWAAAVFGLLCGGDSVEGPLTLVIAIGCCKVLY